MFCFVNTDMSSLALEDIDSVSEAGGAPPLMPEHLHHHNRNNINHHPMGGGGGVAPGGPPLRLPTWTNTYNSNPYGPSYMPPPPLPPQNMNYAPPAPYLNDSASYISMPGNGAESVHSGSGMCAF